MDVGQSDVLIEARLAELLREFETRARPIRIVRKRGVWHQRAADVLLRVLTFGGQRHFLDQYVTTLGHTIYVPDDFDTRSAASRYEVLRHEAVHVAQFERYGWVLMVLVYGLLPLPIGLAYGRARLEWQAYRETLRTTVEIEGFDRACDPALHEEIVRRFTGPDYAWMWPFPKSVRRWIARALAEMKAEG